MTDKIHNKPRRPVGDDRDFVKDLVNDYVRGTITAEEIHRRLAADPNRVRLLNSCRGTRSLPQQLLEEVGLSAYDMEISFRKPLLVTREGLRRNLKLARENRLSIQALCEWSTDRLAWDIVAGQGCEDDVVKILANEFSHGEDYARRIVSSRNFVALFDWHLDHTAPQDAELVRLGLFVEHWRSSLRDTLQRGLTARTSDSHLAKGLSELFQPLSEHAPVLVRDFIIALNRLESHGGADQIDELITCVTRTGKPVACTEGLG